MRKIEIKLDIPSELGREEDETTNYEKGSAKIKREKDREIEIER